MPTALKDDKDTAPLFSVALHDLCSSVGTKNFIIIGQGKGMWWIKYLV
jgi:hypothetical protein